MAVSEKVIEGKEEAEAEDGEFHLFVRKARHERGGGEAIGNTARRANKLAKEAEAIDFFLGLRVGR